MIKPNQKKEPTTDSLSWAETKTQIVDLIEETFSNPRFEILKSLGLQQLKMLEDHIQDTVLKETFQEIGVAKSSKFLVALGCFATIEDYYYEIENILDEYEPDTFSDLVGDFTTQADFDEIKKICDFLMLSKDSIINDFVIPHYKVFKSSHIWLEEQTESALNKAIDRHFNFVNHHNEIFGFIQYDIFETADHVSIFEYFMQGQDLEIELKIQEEIANKAVMTANPISLYDLLTDEEKRKWTSPFLKAFQEVEFSRIADSEIDSVIDYVLSVFNRVVYNWEMNPELGQIILDDLKKFSQEVKLLERIDFFIQGMKAGYSPIVLRQYPSGFISKDEDERWFPRAFIISDEGQVDIDEALYIIENLPTATDRMVGKVLLEDYCKTFPKFASQEMKTSCYYFDGVNALARHLGSPYPDEDKFGQEIADYFRKVVKNLNRPQLIRLMADWGSEFDEEFKGYPSWVGFDDYLFIKTLSTKVGIPKRIISHYKQIFNEVREAYESGNY